LNPVVTSVFDSIRNEHSYSKFLNTYRHQFLTYLTEWCQFFTLATTPSNQQNQQTWSRLLAHYGHQVLKLLQQKPQQCGAIKQLNLFNKYLLQLVTFETDVNYSSRFDLK